MEKLKVWKMKGSVAEILGDINNVYSSSPRPNNKPSYDSTNMYSGKPVSVLGLLIEQRVKVYLQECGYSPGNSSSKPWMIVSPYLPQTLYSSPSPRPHAFRVELFILDWEMCLDVQERVL